MIFGRVRQNKTEVREAIYYSSKGQSELRQHTLQQQQQEEELRVVYGACFCEGVRLG